MHWFMYSHFSSKSITRSVLRARMTSVNVLLRCPSWAANAVSDVLNKHDRPIKEESGSMFGQIDDMQDLIDKTQKTDDLSTETTARKRLL